MGWLRSCHGCRTMAPAWEHEQGQHVGPEVCFVLVRVSRTVTTDRPKALLSCQRVLAELVKTGLWRSDFPVEQL